MAKKRSTFGNFLPRGKKSKNDIIRVDDPKLAQFLADLASGQSAVLTEDLLATEDVGGVEANETFFEAGTPLEDIIRLMLQGTPTISINFQRVVDNNLNLFIWNTILYPGDEANVGGVGFTYDDPLLEVAKIQVSHQGAGGAIESFTTQFDGSAFTPNVNSVNVVDIADFTIGGITSQDPYITTNVAGGTTNNASLSVGFQLSMFNAEDNQVGNVQGASMYWAPPAFMINLNHGQIAAGDYTDFAQWEAQLSIYALGIGLSFASDRVLYEAAIKTRLEDPDWYPITKHTRNGVYDATAKEGYNQTGDFVTWAQPSVPDTVQIGLGDTGAPTTFYDANNPVKALFFIPNGGSVASNVNNFILKQGDGTLTYSSIDDWYFDIGANGLGFATTTDTVLINYRIIYLDQDNNIPPGATPLTFNNP